MKNVIITGGTGMVGGLVLNECLLNTEIESVTSIVRKASGVNHPKLTEVIHTDFTNYRGLENYFTGKDIAYFCIGVYTGTVPRDEFRKITIDYTVEFAKVLKANSPDATFCFLSGQGADQTEKSKMMFAKDKGIAENFLLSQKFNSLYIFRPGYIYPLTPRVEPNFTYSLFRKLYPFLRFVMPSNVVTSELLAKAIFITGLKGGEKTVLENKDISKIKLYATL